ncbi:MAG: flavodoxin [Coriobacteriia bacterium]|nr:flavodoxin [Coriobacteriia bacterium]
MTKNMLVVYYSWTNGNTRKIAEQLAAACGADLERIDTVVPYPDDYDATVSQAQDEVNAGFKPEIKALEHDLANYDVVAIGTPTWWYTMAPAVKTFISNANWEGKTVVAFSTSAGWPGSTNRDIQNAAIGAATTMPSLEVTFDSSGGTEQKTPQADVDAWIAAVKESLD